MVRKSKESLTDLYMADEVAWLDAMVELIGNGSLSELDCNHLREYLQDMANRDRREIKNRLKVLLTHLLKWQYQKEMRTSSWRNTVNAQRDDLNDDLETSGTLRNHAEEILAETYAKAVKRASDETELPEKTFPAECPWTLEQLLSREVLEP